MARALNDQQVGVYETGFDRRKAKRLFLNFSVEISGTNRGGQPFAERTKTDDISETGCRLVMTNSVKCGDFVEIKPTAPEGTRLPEETAQQFEVMWVHPTKSGWSIGARKVQSGKIWKVTFPPTKSSS